MICPQAANDDYPPVVDGTPESTQRFWAARDDLQRATAQVLDWIDLVDTSRRHSVIDGLVFFTLWSSNIAHLPAQPAGDEHDLADDAQRRPVTAPQIAATLGLSDDTVRRRVLDLVAEGLVDRVIDGFIVPRRIVLRPDIITSVRRSHDTLVDMLRQAQDAGLRA